MKLRPAWGLDSWDMAWELNKDRSRWWINRGIWGITLKENRPADPHEKDI